jgi:hypothetical protein
MVCANFDTVQDRLSQRHDPKHYNKLHGLGSKDIVEAYLLFLSTDHAAQKLCG